MKVPWALTAAATVISSTLCALVTVPPFFTLFQLQFCFVLASVFQILLGSRGVLKALRKLCRNIFFVEACHFAKLVGSGCLTETSLSFEEVLKPVGANHLLLRR
jgi:hypothetical protein